MSEYEVIGDAEDIEVKELSQSQKSSQYSYRHSSQSSYDPSDSSQFSSSSEDENPPVSAKECVIVEQDQLLQLFHKCRRAGCTAAVDEDDIQINRTGAAIHVVATCNNSHVEHWMSSSTVGEGHSKLFVVNVLLATFTLLCGLNIGQIVEFFKHMKILCISDDFFNAMQRQILHKIVWMSWCYEQKTVIEEIKQMQRQGKKNAVAGDAKYDSPGYCATFCTYTVQSLLNKKIISLWVAHKSIVSSSGKMETFCAKTLILNLAWEHELEIHSLTTDRAKDMKALMSELYVDLPPGYPIISHLYDTWHWVKSVMKQVFAAAKLKSCHDLGPWLPSIQNHLWWCFGSSVDDLELLREKLDSTTEHLSNIHSFGGNKRYLECEHEPLAVEEERGKAWLTPDSLAVNKVKNAIHGHQNIRFKDLENMTEFTHTGDLENYHSLGNKYCAKRYKYSHDSMLVRSCLTALDYNSNVTRSQAKTAAGVPRFSLVKQRNAKKYNVRKVKVEKDYSFRDNIASLVLKSIENGTTPKVVLPIGQDLPAVRGVVEKPDKQQAVLLHESRFL